MLLVFFAEIANASYEPPLLTQEERQWLVEHPNIRFTGDPNWLPFEGFDKNGNYQGIVAEHLNFIEKVLAIRFHIVVSDSWKKSIAMARTGDVDILSETNGSSLKSQLVFTDTYASSPVVIVMDWKQQFVESLEQIEDKTIGLIGDYGYIPTITSRYPNYRYLEVEDIDDGLLALSTGRIDALLCTATLCSYHIAKSSLHNIRIVGKTEFVTELVFGVRRDFEPLVRILNKAIAQMTEIHRQQIMDKWSLQKYAEKTDYLLVWQLMTVLGVVLAFFSYRQFQLKKYNRRLTQSEKRYARAIRGTSDGIWEWNITSGQLFFSPRWQALLGYSFKELPTDAHSFFHLLHKEDVSRFRRELNAHLKTNSAFKMELRMKRSDGQYHWYQLVGEVERNDKNQPVVMAGALSDIDQRKLIQSLGESRNYVLGQIAKGDDLQNILNTILSRVEEKNPHMFCSILLLDDEGRHLTNGVALRLPAFYMEAVDGITIGDGVGSCGTAAALKKRVIVEDIQTHPYWKGFRSLAADAELASCWSEPVLDSKEELLGTFAIYQQHPSKPSANDILIIEQAATLAGIAIEKNKATEKLQLASLVYENSSEAMLIFDAERFIISVNPAFSQITGYLPEEVVGKKADILNSELQDRDFYEKMRASVKESGRWQGEVKDRKKNGEIYIKWLVVNTIFNEDGSVHRRLSLFSDITEKKKSEETIWKQANFDALTGLPNRSLFNERLAREIERSERENSIFALMLIDLDRFKEVNDTLGHDTGDRLLIDSARRITACVRKTDTVARLGGDEFTIILPDIKNLSALEKVAENIIHSLASPFQLADEMIYVSASIGITLYPEDTQDFNSLLKNADQAMYQAKNLGRNRYQYFTQRMQVAAQRKIRLISELRTALNEQQFYLVYQPIVRLKDNKIHKAEALLRWRHPSNETISPAEFIPLAEETGLIIKLGDWVFREAAKQSARWRANFDNEFEISINTSPVQYHIEGIGTQDWPGYLETLGLPGDAVVMEITEGLMMDASSAITEQMLAYRSAGIQVALDDFGTGYSSLSYLKKFDIDFVKIDQSFVRNLETDGDNLALCEAIIVMAHKLNLQVIAEGVETDGQRQLLEHIGCDFAQGYLFAKPLEPAEFEKKLANN